ncbi:MAG: ATP synthase F0 subunit C [Eubacterium sp.]|nr:ATP synthase F0 subunit C [Eubacterium sp.]
MKKALITLLLLFAAFGVFSAVAPASVSYAAEETTATEETEDAEAAEGNSTAGKAIAAAISIGIAAGLGALGMGLCVGKAAEGIARQPEAEGKIRTTMILGIVFIETAVLYALVISILIIFVL